MLRKEGLRVAGYGLYILDDLRDRFTCGMICTPTAPRVHHRTDRDILNSAGRPRLLRSPVKYWNGKKIGRLTVVAFSAVREHWDALVRINSVAGPAIKDGEIE